MLDRLEQGLMLRCDEGYFLRMHCELVLHIKGCGLIVTKRWFKTLTEWMEQEMMYSGMKLTFGAFLFLWREREIVGGGGG